jgi:BCD family chlorophyll transporter-like MFS transporter
MALALLVGTLNRVMIVELGVPAALVAVMVALPVLYAPMRALVGFRSDNHRCALGWRRVPFIWTGTLMQFGGFAVMPFALLVLSGGGDAASWPGWIGPVGAGLCFLMVGAGLHTAQTAGLALATDLSPASTHPRVVGFMCVMLLVGTMFGAFAFGAALRDFTPGRLVQVLQAAALASMILNSIALWKQETRRPPRGARLNDPPPEFAAAWQRYAARDGTALRLLVIAVGGLAFGMQDVLLEPYGGQVLGLDVGATTWLTATLAAGGLVGFSVASAVLSGGKEPARVALLAALVGLPAFAAVISSAWSGGLMIFVAGVFGIGLAAGLFGHATLTLTMNRAPADQAGLALGTWGAVQATAAGLGVALGGLGRDLVHAVAMSGQFGPAFAQPATGYAAIYGIEFLLLLLTVALSLRLIQRQGAPS